jgi:hypothetical protein
MSANPVWLLSLNASLQVLVSSLLGVVMLLPMQPWGKKLLPSFDPKALLSTHLDWLMLAFMQWGAAFCMAQFPHCRSSLAAQLLVFGGWTNALPYLLRAFRINAFVLAGPPKQLVSAAIAGLSSLAIICAWGLIVWRLW